MESFISDFLNQALNDEYSLAKALAHFMFREIVEDIHAENRITDEEMEQLSRDACNRASLFVNHIMNDPDMRLAFSTESMFAREWDPPIMTDELNMRLELYKSIASEIKP